MKDPKAQDIYNLANYILSGEDERKDFVEQILIGDLAPETLLWRKYRCIAKGD